MNILSHYYAGRREGRPYYNLGLVFPDFIGVVNRTWKPGKFNPYPEPWYNDLVEGCLAHLQVDRVFHSLDAFKENVSFIRKKFEENDLKIEGIRLFFVAHIFLELMLDRLIILNDRKQADSFYEGLDKISEENMKLFFERNGIGNMDGFNKFFESFKTHRYLYHYINDERLMFAMNRIMQRAGQPCFEERHLPIINRIAKEMEEHLAPQIDDIFKSVAA